MELAGVVIMSLGIAASTAAVRSALRNAMRP